MQPGAQAEPLSVVPVTSRLYDVTVGAVTAMYAFACALRPPMKLYAVGDRPMPFGTSPGSGSKTFSPSYQRLMWKWQPLPVRCANGLGMNVAMSPRSWAIDSTM